MEAQRVLLETSREEQQVAKRHAEALTAQLTERWEAGALLWSRNLLQSLFAWSSSHRSVCACFQFDDSGRIEADHKPHKGEMRSGVERSGRNGRRFCCTQSVELSCVLTLGTAAVCCSGASASEFVVAYRFTYKCEKWLSVNMCGRWRR